MFGTLAFFLLSWDDLAGCVHDWLMMYDLVIDSRWCSDVDDPGRHLLLFGLDDGPYF